MLVLTETTDNLQVVLAGAITTNQLRCVSSWRDVTASAYTPGRTLINTNSTTDVTVVGSPAASNATSAATTQNYAQIEGLIRPSAGGTFIARFASEVLSSAIVAKAGSMVHYQQLD